MGVPPIGQLWVHSIFSLINNTTQLPRHQSNKSPVWNNAWWNKQLYYVLPNKATVHYPKLTQSCCLWSNNPSCNKHKYITHDHSLIYTEHKAAQNSLPHLSVGSPGHSLWGLLSSTLQSDNRGSQHWVQNGEIHSVGHNSGHNLACWDLKMGWNLGHSIAAKSLSNDCIWSGRDDYHWCRHTQQKLNWKQIL